MAEMSNGIAANADHALPAMLPSMAGVCDGSTQTKSDASELVSYMLTLDDRPDRNHDQNTWSAKQKQEPRLAHTRMDQLR